jgi:hypothetical protein
MNVITSGKVEVLTSSGRDRWNELYNSLPSQLQDINFSFDYHNLYSYDGEICLFYYSAGDEKFYYPFQLKKINSEEPSLYDIETVYGYTGPLTTSHSAEFISAADSAFLAYCHSNNIISEFIRFHPLLHNENIAPNLKGMESVHLRNYISVDLQPSIHRIFESYNPKNKNKIRKAEKSGIRISSENNDVNFAAFHEIYIQNMRALNAAPMYFFASQFFEQLKKLISENGVLLTALKDESAIGSAVFLKGKELGHYFLSSVTVDGKNSGAGNLLLHQGVQWCKSNGLRLLHLGGGITPDENDALLTFKKNFSSRVEQFYIGKRIHDRAKYNKLTSTWDVLHDREKKYQNILQRYRLILPSNE